MPQKDRQEMGTMERGGKGQGSGGRYVCPGGTKDFPLVRVEIDLAFRQMVVYKGEKKKRMSYFVLIGHVYRVAKRELLIAELQYFYSWTLVVSLRGRK